MRLMLHNRELYFPMGLTHFLRKKKWVFRKKSLQKQPRPQKEFSITCIRDNVLSCSGLIAAVEFQVWLKDKMQLTLLLKYYVLKRRGIITLYSTLLASKEPLGDCLRNYSHLPTPGNSPWTWKERAQSLLQSSHCLSSFLKPSFAARDENNTRAGRAQSWLHPREPG